jgi:hypothetical protein
MEILSRHRTTSQFAIIFQLNKTTVRKNLVKDPQEPTPFGRDLTGNSKVRYWILSPIVESYQRSHALTRKVFCN